MSVIAYAIFRAFLDIIVLTPLMCFFAAVGVIGFFSVRNVAKQTGSSLRMQQYFFVILFLVGFISLLWLWVPALLYDITK